MSVMIVVSSRSAPWLDFNQALEKATEVQIEMVETGVEAVDAARHKHPLAIIIDEANLDWSASMLVCRLLEINAMIHIAWASGLSEERFHEKTEGLGVLMKLPPNPGTSDAIDLVDRLRKIGGAI